MPEIPADIVAKLSIAQNQIAQTISLTVSEATGQAVTFGTPLTVSTRTSDLYAEISAPMLVVQFCFSGLPENPQIILIPQETTAGLAEITTGNKTPDIDENIVSDLRPITEAIIQGICLAASQIKNDTVVASGLSIRYQILALPANLQSADYIVRSQIGVSGDGVNGTAIWLLDSETAHFILNETFFVPDDAPFSFAAPGSADVASHHAEDTSGIDRLLDIPLEITVELGRVRMLVKDVIDLGTGSIVEIEKAAGEPVDVKVNGRLVARGEVVVIEDNFGVRITEILSQQDRLNRLNDAA